MRVIQPTSKRIGRFLEVPNLIELQLNSYKWFLEEGLPELFKTFSPIWDFTQTNYIEFVSFTLGEPKYSIQDCRERDMTFEAPIKATVRFGGRDRAARPRRGLALPPPRRFPHRTLDGSRPTRRVRTAD